MYIPQEAVNLRAVAGRGIDSHPELGNIFFDIENRAAVATNGHILHTARISTDGFAESFMLPAEDFKGIKYGAEYDPDTETLKYATDKSGIKFVQISSKKVTECKYPDWKKLVPLLKPVVHVRLSNAVLKQLIDVSKSSTDGTVVLGVPENPNGAIETFYRTGEIENMGLLMPMQAYPSEE